MLDKKPKGRLRMARDIHSRNPDAVLGREDLVGRILNWINCEAICAVGATTKAFDRAAGHVEALSIVTAERLPAHVWRRFRAVREVLFVWRPKTEHDATLAHFFDAAVLVGQQWRSVAVRTDYESHHHFDATFKPVALRCLRTLRLAVARGALPRLDHFGVDYDDHTQDAGLWPVTTDGPKFMTEIAALAEVLPPFCGARLAISLLEYIRENGLAARVLGRILDLNPAFDVNHRTRRHGPLLHDAIRRPRGVDGEERAQALARVLLERGADPNLASLRYGTTPCGEAAGISKDFMKLIVQAGGRLASDPSPFFYACGGEVRLWRMNFGEGGWRVDNFRSIGSHARYYVPRPEVVEYLLDRGADPREDFGGGRRASDILQDLLAQAHSGMRRILWDTPYTLGEEGAHKIRQKLMGVQDVIKKLEAMLSAVSAAVLRVTQEQLRAALAAAAARRVSPPQEVPPLALAP